MAPRKMTVKGKGATPRNPIARVVRGIRPQVIPDKRRAASEAALDEMVAEAQRLGLYEGEPLVGQQQGEARDVRDAGAGMEEASEDS